VLEADLGSNRPANVHDNQADDHAAHRQDDVRHLRVVFGSHSQPVASSAAAVAAGRSRTTDSAKHFYSFELKV